LSGHVPLKCQLNFNGLHSIISQTTQLRTSNPTFFYQFIFEVLYFNISPPTSRRCEDLDWKSYFSEPCPTLK
jgi:hypothetical protein